MPFIACVRPVFTPRSWWKNLSTQKAFSDFYEVLLCIHATDNVWYSQQNNKHNIKHVPNFCEVSFVSNTDVWYSKQNNEYHIKLTCIFVSNLRNTDLFEILWILTFSTTQDLQVRTWCFIINTQLFLSYKIVLKKADLNHLWNCWWSGLMTWLILIFYPHHSFASIASVQFII